MNIKTIYDKQINSYHQYRNDFSIHAFNFSKYFSHVINAEFTFRTKLQKTIKQG